MECAYNNGRWGEGGEWGGGRMGWGQTDCKLIQIVFSRNINDQVYYAALKTKTFDVKHVRFGNDVHNCMMSMLQHKSTHEKKFRPLLSSKNHAKSCNVIVH